MNVAQARPRTWTPHIIVFSIVLHAVVLYYIAVTLNIVKFGDFRETEPPHYVVQQYVEPLKLPDPDPILIKPKPWAPHVPKVPPVQPNVDLVPLPPAQPTDVQGPPQPVRVDGEIREQPTLRILPPYPDRAAIEDREGVVFLSITIMPDGSVQDVQIVNAKPRGYFESSALNAVRQWRYAPSNTIRKNVIVRMDFELK